MHQMMEPERRKFVDAHMHIDYPWHNRNNDITDSVYRLWYARKIIVTVTNKPIKKKSQKNFHSKSSVMIERSDRNKEFLTKDFASYQNKKKKKWKFSSI